MQSVTLGIALCAVVLGVAGGVLLMRPRTSQVDPGLRAWLGGLDPGGALAPRWRAWPASPSRSRWRGARPNTAVASRWRTAARCPADAPVPVAAAVAIEMPVVGERARAASRTRPSWTPPDSALSFRRGLIRRSWPGGRGTSEALPVRRNRFLASGGLRLSWGVSRRSARRRRCRPGCSAAAREAVSPARGAPSRGAARRRSGRRSRAARRASAGASRPRRPRARRAARGAARRPRAAPSPTCARAARAQSAISTSCSSGTPRARSRRGRPTP